MNNNNQRSAVAAAGRYDGGEVTVRRTNRGFSVYSEFKDSVGQHVKIQRSSSVEPRVWIFCNEERPVDGSELAIGPYVPAHLSVAQAKRVIRALSKFIAEEEGDR